MTMFLRNFNPSVFNYYALKAKHRISQSRWPHDLTGTIPSFHCSIPEALNGGMVWGGSVPAVATFCLFCRERLVTNSAIHKAAGLMRPSRSMILWVLFHHSTVPTMKPSMGEQPLGSFLPPVFLGTASN